MEVAKGLVCDSANIKIETRLEHVLLSKRSISWTIKNFNEVKKTKASILTQTFTFEIEENEEMPRIEWRVSLMPPPSSGSSQGSRDEDAFLPWTLYGRSVHGLGLAADNANEVSGDHDIRVNCEMVSGYGELSEDTIFTVELELLNKDEVVENRFCASNEDFDSKIINFELSSPPYYVPRRQWDLPVSEDGSLVLHLTFQFFKKQLAVDKFEQEVDLEMLEQLTSHLKAKAKADGESVKGMGYDVRVISSDGNEFSFHRQLLTARSPVFEAMFRSRMTESQSGIIELEDLSVEVVRFMHHFIYRGDLSRFLEKIKNEGEMACELEPFIYLASKYQFQDMLTFFNKAIGTLCNEDNALDLLKLTNKFSLVGGREFVKTFISKNQKVLDNF